MDEGEGEGGWGSHWVLCQMQGMGRVETIAEVENLVCRLLCFAWWLYFGLLE